MGWSLAQQKALAIAPKCSASLSILGSGWIVTELIMMPEKRASVYHRLLGSFAFFDILESAWNIASTWPIPEGTEGVWKARGTTATCTAQGFFLQMGVALPLYNGSIALYYMYTIRYNLSEKRVKRRIEPWIQGIPILFAFGTSIAGLILKLYNNAELWCWIAELPDDCTNGEGLECIRGEHAESYRFAFFYVPLWIVFGVLVWALAKVYIGIYRCEKKTIKYRNPTVANLRQARSNDTDNSADGEDKRRSWSDYLSMYEFVSLYPKSYQVASQSLCYILVFCFVYSFGTVDRILQVMHDNRPFGLLMLHAFFDPLHGFLNWLVYRRPKYISIRNRNPELSRLQAFWRICQWTAIENKKKKARPPPPTESLATSVSIPSTKRSRRMSALVRMEVIQDTAEGIRLIDSESYAQGANGNGHDMQEIEEEGVESSQGSSA